MPASYPNPFIGGFPNFLNGIGQPRGICYGSGKSDGNNLILHHPLYRKCISKILKYRRRWTFSSSKPKELFTYISHILDDSRQTIYSGGHGYSYCPFFNTTLSKVNDFAIGFELECDVKSPHLRSLLYSEDEQSRDRGSRPFISNWFFVKRDSSLDRSTGIEVTSIPLSRRFCLNPDLWNGLTHYLSVFARDHDCTANRSRDWLTYGFHVHVNSMYFLSDKQTHLSSDTQHELSHYAGLLCNAFYYSLWETYPMLLDYVFGRTLNRFCYLPRNCATPSWAQTLRSLLSHASLFNTDGFSTSQLDKISKVVKQITNSEANRNLVQSLLASSFSDESLLSALQGPSCLAQLSSTSSIASSTRMLHKQFFSYDDEPHHACVNANIHTIEFRQGKASLNPEKLYLIVSFIYAFCSFVKRLMQSQLRDPEKNVSERDFAKEFFTYTTNHSANTHLRSLCSALLHGNTDPVAKVPLPSTKEFRLAPLTERQGD